VATISRLLKIIGLFCKKNLQKRPIFSKETYNFKEPTNRSHPITNLKSQLNSPKSGNESQSQLTAKFDV